MRYIHIYTSFSNDGGAQRVVWNLFKYLNPNEDNYLAGNTKSNHCLPKFQTGKYLRFTLKNIFIKNGAIFISHHRKLTTFLMLLQRTILPHLNVIHVAHNEFNNFKKITILPDNIIAVSNKVKTNLVSYFKVNPSKINVVYNGLEDKFKNTAIKQYNKTDIRILYPARINKVKQQVKIVEQLKNCLNHNISIDFAGEGEDSDKLDKICMNTNQFNYIGFVNIENRIVKYDFVMLFTQNEGLPLSLIEACMFQKPILANDVGGNLEILEDKSNGFKLSNFEALADELNKLQLLSNDSYANLASNARKSYELKFTIDKMLSKYREVIQVNK